MSVPNERKDLMLNNKNQTANIMKHRETDRREDVLSRGVKQCCPFLTRVRFYKTQSLKDKKIFSTLNDGNMEKRRKVNNEINENTGTSMMYYL
ncbi:MAG: hypothetical protein U9O95_04880 [Candidatus Marinimicrobia bacterium]|nr:hypothetical protein [Candidatus Neomarinimicrobiota bacterium]